MSNCQPDRPSQQRTHGKTVADENRWDHYSPATPLPWTSAETTFPDSWKSELSSVGQRTRVFLSMREAPAWFGVRHAPHIVDKLRGIWKVGWQFLMTAAAFNLGRLPKHQATDAYVERAAYPLLNVASAQRL